jgi:hypothetical protein
VLAVLFGDLSNEAQFTFFAMDSLIGRIRSGLMQVAIVSLERSFRQCANWSKTVIQDFDEAL